MSEQTIRNEYGEVVLISHPRRKDSSQGLTGETPTQIANGYIRQNMATMGLTQSRMEDDETSLSDVSRADDPIICFSHEKDVAGSRVVVYDQKVMGLLIFGAGIGVHIDSAGLAVTSAQSSLHGQVHVANPDQKSAENGVQPLRNAMLKEMLGIVVDNMQDDRVERQVVYRFEPDQRVEVAEDEREGSADARHALDLPSLPDGIAKGMHYIVNEVLFRASLHNDEPPINWRALVEPKSRCGALYPSASRLRNRHGFREGSANADRRDGDRRFFGRTTEPVPINRPSGGAYAELTATAVGQLC